MALESSYQTSKMEGLTLTSYWPEVAQLCCCTVHTPFFEITDVVSILYVRNPHLVGIAPTSLQLLFSRCNFPDRLTAHSTA